MVVGRPGAYFEDGQPEINQNWREQSPQWLSNLQICQWPHFGPLAETEDSRARHIKCDEQKPSCQRCIRSKRECSGYADPALMTAKSKRQTFVLYIPDLPYPMISRPDLNWQERRAFDFFQTQTAPAFGGHFSPDLWSKFVLLGSQHEKAIKHAVVALGTLHERFLNASCAEDLHPDADFAMQHYGKAMKNVVALDTQASIRAIDVALTASILFACIEIVKQHYISALSHIYSGMKIFDELARRSSTSPKFYVPRDLFIQMFLRLDI